MSYHHSKSDVLRAGNVDPMKVLDKRREGHEVPVSDKPLEMADATRSRRFISDRSVDPNAINA
jgi:hypothetical protein